MQILLQSMEDSKPKLLDDSALWFVMPREPLIQSLATYSKNIPSHYENILVYLVKKYCLNDSYIFKLKDIEYFRDKYPFYKKFCYFNRFPFSEYEANKTQDIYEDWYAQELRDDVVGNNDYFYDLVVDEAYMLKVNLYYQGFVEHIKSLYSLEMKKHARVRDYLKPELDWLNNMQERVSTPMVKSLRKYSLTMGLNFVENKSADARAKVEKFIPAGVCFYDKYIFINTHYYARPHKAFKNKLNAKEVFAHELGHAVSMSGQDILRNPQRMPYGCHHHSELKKIVKRTWNNYPSHQLCYFQKNYLNYFTMPNQVQGKVNWTRACEETFAESFAFIFDIVLNGFSPVHVHCKKDKIGMMAFHLKNMAPAVLWMLETLRWESVFPDEKRLDFKLKKIKDYFSNIPEAIPDRQKRLKANLNLIKYSPKTM